MNVVYHTWILNIYDLELYLGMEPMQLIVTTHMDIFLQNP